MEQKEKYLEESMRHINIADHMAYVTYPLVRERKLLMKVFDEINKSIIDCINAILLNEHEKYNINLTKEESENIKIFIKLSEKYNINKENIKKIIEILEVNKKHKESAMEFARKEKVVIMMDDLKTITIDVDKVKEYLSLAKALYIKANLIINQ